MIRTELEAALRAPLGPEAREAVVAALEECDALIGLAEDLLVLARTDERGLPIQPRTLTAPDLLEGVRRRFADRARERGRAITVHVAGGLRLEGDELRLRQALGNLVDNALRHGAGAIALRASADDGAVVLEVADHGPGFPPELAGRAFERFARGDAARTASGAGLAIACAIAKAHGGHAEIPPVAEGAVVRLRLPAQRDLSGPA